MVRQRTAASVSGGTPRSSTREDGEEGEGTLASLVEEGGTPFFFNTTSHSPCAVSPSTLYTTGTPACSRALDWSTGAGSCSLTTSP
eukprot:CAMPEP_0171736298 /NCGR_PEP_ID=MMETSP0991-20121206/32144_1 /TAXON_ID=483369 /ORGANISM="non described non described, Strain CCMP2098" /LENGTH=85 /DNA_ID=CAMNT_0012332877 /DNA_START=38 /DNA_END=292 /DNA_ORIENTATION=+